MTWQRLAVLIVLALVPVMLALVNACAFTPACMGPMP